MNGYDRCSLHHLMRCQQCNPVTTHFMTPNAHVAPAGFNPEDALDRSIGTPSGSAVPSTAPAIDKQTLEAIERRKAMQAKTPVEVSFGEVPVGVKIEPEPERKVEAPAILGAPYEFDETVSSKDVNLDLYGSFASTADPLVLAAKAYSEAQIQANIATKKIGLLRIEIQEAKNTRRTAMKEVRARKAELKKLVQS